VVAFLKEIDLKKKFSISGNTIFVASVKKETFQKVLKNAEEKEEKNN